MEFKVNVTSGNIDKYIPILNKYCLEMRTSILKYKRKQLNYYIRIDNLKQLMTLIKSLNNNSNDFIELIIGEDAIEIYDDYRE
jgi:hypothetical protein